MSTLQRHVATMCIICLLVCALAALFTQDAYADSTSARSTDKNIAERRGVSGSLAQGKEVDEDRMPNKVQMWVGIGSVFVAVAVVKWL